MCLLITCTYKCSAQSAHTVFNLSQLECISSKVIGALQFRHCAHCDGADAAGADALCSVLHFQ